VSRELIPGHSRAHDAFLPLPSDSGKHTDVSHSAVCIAIRANAWESKMPSEVKACCQCGKPTASLFSGLCFDCFFNAVQPNSANVNPKSRAESAGGK